MEKTLNFCVICSLPLLAFGPFVRVPEVASASDPSSKFTITSRKKDDSIRVRIDAEKTAFIVKSPSGISQVVIERHDESWPKAVVLRLHLKGLESFRASNGKNTLDAAISSQDNKQRVRGFGGMARRTRH
jgi:hypothetical protein